MEAEAALDMDVDGDMDDKTAVGSNDGSTTFPFYLQNQEGRVLEGHLHPEKKE